MDDSEPNPSDEALAALMRHLGRREHSEKELKTKLNRKFSPWDVEAAIAYAHAQNWLSAPEELAQRTSEQLHQKNKSDRYIQHYLETKGLPPVPRQPDREREKCRSLLHKKFEKIPARDFEQRHKAYRFLGNRGFDAATIKEVLQDYEE